MPLEDGLDAFAEGYGSFRPEPQVLRAFFDSKEAILSAFSSNPSLRTKPYQCRWLQSGLHSLPAEFPTSNPIYVAILDQKLEKFGLRSVKYLGWKNVETTKGPLPNDHKVGYSLIDLACYLVYLLNIYVPNKPLIQNLVSVHTKLDALGRENTHAAEVAIEKLIRKNIKQKQLFGFITMLPEQASDLYVLAKHDAVKRNQVVTAGRGIDFERGCEVHLIRSGFSVQTTPTTGDYGADLLAWKDSLGFAIQCKDTSKPVGVKAVQEAVAARSHYKVDFAVVCASAGFTDAAVELATSNKVILCNADQLVKRLESV